MPLEVKCSLGWRNDQQVGGISQLPINARVGLPIGLCRFLRTVRAGNLAAPLRRNSRLRPQGTCGSRVGASNPGVHKPEQPF